ncbi:MAG: prepilin peptidase [Leucobacter sp.]
MALTLVSFAAFSIVLSVVDVRERRLPDRLVLPGTVVTAALALAAIVAAQVEYGAGSGSTSTMLATRGGAVRWAFETLGGGIALFVAFLGIVLLRPGAFGGGDVKAALMVGCVLGFAGGWTALLIGTVCALGIAAVWGAVLRGRRSRVSKNTEGEAAELPFGPCLFAGGWIGAALATPTLFG